MKLENVEGEWDEHLLRTIRSRNNNLFKNVADVNVNVNVALP